MLFLRLPSFTQLQLLLKRFNYVISTRPLDIDLPHKQLALHLLLHDIVSSIYNALTTSYIEKLQQLHILLCIMLHMSQSNENSISNEARHLTSHFTMCFCLLTRISLWISTSLEKFILLCTFAQVYLKLSES